jgi:1-pyrroline-5-carboxylate dehydrogenase
MGFKITYSAMSGDLTEVHKQFDQTLQGVVAKLGDEYPSWIGGQAVRTGAFMDDRNPADTRQLLGRFHAVSLLEIDRAVEVARHAQRTWGATPWRERVRVLRKAAELFSERALEISAIVSLEVGKNRLESLGDTEESADLIRYYAKQMEDADGFVKPLGSLNANEQTRSVLRPWGVFAVVSPFNFPMALAVGMSSGALLGGNTAILKPSQDTPWSAQKIYEVFRDAGLPEGVFQLIYGEGAAIGRALTDHPGVDGVAFTGSKQVGMDIFHRFNAKIARPCFLELGGKNPLIVCQGADLDKAAEGAVRSAFGMSGQKCSALSRIYVHKDEKKKFVEMLVARAQALKIGDPLRQEVYMGPVINQKAHTRYVEMAAIAKREGRVALGAEDLRAKGGEYGHGWFVAPTIVEIAHGHRLTREELFLPLVTVSEFTTLEEAVRQANDSEYGLTAGFFSERPADVEYFLANIQAGVLYTNRRAGATTGAWPGVQAFCGWKGSGSSGKGGCGPYYVSQFMREQSHTIVG